MIFTIGIISDTHGLLRPEALRVLADVDHIIHCGDIGDPETLVQIAVEQGFDEQAARDELANGELRETIIGLETHAAQVGVTGVPFFIVDGKLAVSGAQTGDVWAQVFQQVMRDAA